MLNSLLQHGWYKNVCGRYHCLFSKKHRRRQIWRTRKNRVLPDIFRSASKAPWMSQPSLVSWTKKPQVMIKCANVTMYSYNWSLLKGLMCIIKMVLWAWNENWKNCLFRFIWRYYKWCWCQTFHGAARLHHNMSPVAQDMHLLGVPLGIHSDIAGRYNLTSVHRYQHKLSAVYFVTIWCYQISHGERHKRFKLIFHVSLGFWTLDTTDGEKLLNQGLAALIFNLQRHTHTPTYRHTHTYG